MSNAYGRMVNSLFNSLLKNYLGYSFVSRTVIFLYNLDNLITVTGKSSSEFDNSLPCDSV